MSVVSHLEIQMQSIKMYSLLKIIETASRMPRSILLKLITVMISVMVYLNKLGVVFHDRIFG